MPLIAWLGAALVTLFTSVRLWVITLIATMVGPLIIKILSSLGIGVVTYTLGSYALDGLFNTIKTNFSALPPEVIPFLAMAKIDFLLTTVFAAFAARLVWQGFSNTGASGTKKTMTFTGGGN